MRANHNRRETRYRELNANFGLSPLGLWDRTVSFSDIDKWMLCPGMYLMWKEGDAIYRLTLSNEIGRIVHQETAKPVAERMQSTSEIAARLHSIPVAERPAMAEEVAKLIAKAVRVSDRESMKAELTKHEDLMCWYDRSTDTYWYAQPDKMDVTTDDFGRHLLVVDQKSGRWRKKSDEARRFFFGYVAKMTKALGFTGTVRTVTRYLKDYQGNLLKKPDDQDMWLGRYPKDWQEQLLYGIRETIVRMDANWKAGSFELHQGDHCKGCQFKHTCPVNRERFEEEMRAKAEQGLIIVQPAAPAAFTDFPTTAPGQPAPWMVNQPLRTNAEAKVTEAA